MSRIQIITAADRLFFDISIKASDATERVGYKIFTYLLNEPQTNYSYFAPLRYQSHGRHQLNSDAVGEKERKVGVCPWKPSLMLHALSQEVNQEKVFIWLDADAWVIRPLDELVAQPFDIAFTMRRPSERGASGWPDVYGYLNTGFVAMRATPATMSFLKLWQLEVDKTESKSDQHAANNLVRRCTDLTEYDKTFQLGNCWIRILKTEEYNYYYLPTPPLPTTKVVHMKKDVRQRESVDEWIEKTKPENL